MALVRRQDRMSDVQGGAPEPADVISTAALTRDDGRGTSTPPTTTTAHPRRCAARPGVPSPRLRARRTRPTIRECARHERDRSPAIGTLHAEARNEVTSGRNSSASSESSTATLTPPISSAYGTATSDPASARRDRIVDPSGRRGRR